jgi:hypothetical protein
MDLHLLYEILKALLMMFGIVRYFVQQKREKALLEEVRNCKQRLEHLESAEKSKKLDN